MAEFLLGVGEIVVGMAVGFAWARIGGRPFPITVFAGAAVLVGIVVYAVTSTNPCPAGEDCEPTTAANWVFLSAGLIGLWLLAVAMGYGVAGRFATRDRPDPR
ncbi:MAG TPA: hypothetical protein VGL44_16845 [Gaiellales bacterium]